MGDLINLKRFKKQKAREQAEQTAEARRSLFGQTAVTRKQEQDRKRALDKTLDQHRLDEDGA